MKKIIIIEIILMTIYLTLSNRIYCCQNNMWILWVLIYISLKMLTTFLISKKKTNLEKIFNYTIALIFSFLEFMSYYVISRIEQTWHWLAIVFGCVWIVLIGFNIREKSNSRNIKQVTLFTVIIVLFSLVLSYVHKDHSTIITGISAILVLLLTSDEIEALMCVKISELRKEQLFFLKYCLTILLPLIYISANMFPIQIDEWHERLLIGAKRFVILEVFLPFFVYPLYITYIRKKIQVFCGLPSEQLFLSGSWNMIVENTYTQHRVIVRNICYRIDGNQIKYNNKIYRVNEKYEIFNEEKEKVGRIQKIDKDEEEIILVFSDFSKVSVVKVNSEKYKKFHKIDNEIDYIFFQEEVEEPFTNFKAKVSLFASPKNGNHFIELNSQTRENYILKNGKLERIELEDIGGEGNNRPGLDILGLKKSETLN